MKNCEFCGKPIPAEKKKARKYCSGACKVKAYRKMNGVPEPFGKRYVTDNNFDGQTTQSYTCCENGRFYSTIHFDYGKILKCDICGAVWELKKEGNKPGLNKGS
jgi:hypothetical protein